ncbi:MAG: tRNA pseudouridine(55) synthase TruB [Blastocatellia bacterium]
MLGALIIDKPEGFTSHDVVARVRRAAGTRRVGHAGTLDPFATGVLVCCIGRATRLVQFLVGLDKEYLATVRLGYATDTQDGTGRQITPHRPSDELSVKDLQQVLDQFIGRQLQTPPMFSAKKVAGERLYHAARAGREVEREPVSIIVHSIEMKTADAGLFTINDDGTRDFCVQVCCSSGTYVRTLAHDIGGRLGVGGHLVQLRRTQVGHFSLADAVSLDELEEIEAGLLQGKLISPSEIVSHLPVVVLEDEQINGVMNGRRLPIYEEQAVTLERDAPKVRLCDSAGNLVAVGSFDFAAGLLSPIVVLTG